MIVICIVFVGTVANLIDQNNCLELDVRYELYVSSISVERSGMYTNYTDPE